MRDKTNPSADSRSTFDYQRYLASREWALLKEQVRIRSGGTCERCRNAPYQETHHLTYAHIGNEQIEDLLAVCHDCHAFLSAKSDYDPKAAERRVEINHGWPLVENPKGFDSNAMMCPGCVLSTGTTYAGALHVSATRHIQGRDYPDGAYGHRYGAGIVDFYCEYGHKFSMVFGDHKGAVYLSFERIRHEDIE